MIPLSVNAIECDEPTATWTTVSVSNATTAAGSFLDCLSPWPSWP